MGIKGSTAGLRFGVLLGLCFMQAARAATLTVTNTNDSGAGSLRQTLSDAALSGDTIAFASEVTGTITLTSGQLVVDKNLTIAGPGPANLTISGNNISRVLKVDRATATISGLRIANGFVTWNPAEVGGGGGIHNSGSLTLRNCEIADNVMSATQPNDNIGAGGGGIFHTTRASTGARRLVLKECLIIGNKVIGAPRAEGFGIDPSTKPGSAADGGGLYIWGSSDPISVVQDCTFARNSVVGGRGPDAAPDAVRLSGGPGRGGAIFSSGNVLVRRCVFGENDAIGGQHGAGSDAPTANLAAGQGGAVYCESRSTLLDSTLDANRAVGGPGIEGTALVGGAGEGGAVYGAPINSRGISGCTLTNNVAQGGDGGTSSDSNAGRGGAIYGKVDFSLSTLALNTARGGEPGGYARGGGAEIRGFAYITSNTVAFNRATSSVDAQGGGLYLEVEHRLRDNLVTANTVNSVSGDASGQVGDTCDHNFIGDGTGLAGAIHGTKGNLIGTHAAPLDAKIHPPALLGGGTATCAIDADSPAVNAGGGSPLRIDQRGYLRMGVNDIGAYESGSVLYEPKILGITRTGNSTVIQGVGIPNAHHRLEITNDPEPTLTNENAPYVLSDAAGLIRFEDAAPNASSGFYRIGYP